MEVTSAFPVPIRIDFTAEAWRRVGHFAQDDFQHLQRFLNDLAERLTVAALSPAENTRLRWTFLCDPGPTGTCELDVQARVLTVLTVEAPGSVSPH